MSVQVEEMPNEMEDEVATTVRTLADLVSDLGDIDLSRILMVPAPGTATLEDVERYKCELIDGTLVRKAMGFRESLLAFFIGRKLGNYAEDHELGVVLGADNFFQVFEGGSRAPDASYVAFASLPGGKLPTKPVPALAPDICVEVLSPGNTVAEMKRKRTQYFTSGVKLVWVVHPVKRTVTIYEQDDQGTVLQATDTLDGGKVVPGFTLSLARVFGELDR